MLHTVLRGLARTRANRADVAFADVCTAQALAGAGGTVGGNRIHSNYGEQASAQFIDCRCSIYGASRAPFCIDGNSIIDPSFLHSSVNRRPVLCVLGPSPPAHLGLTDCYGRV
jgi:hypothetical protein